MSYLEMLKAIHSRMIEMKNGNRNINQGICCNIINHTTLISLTGCAMQRWLEMSFTSFGLDESYPVETHVMRSGNWFRRIAYYVLCENDPSLLHTCSGKWDPRTHRGKFRLELLDRLIESVEKDLKSLTPEND